MTSATRSALGHAAGGAHDGADYELAVVGSGGAAFAAAIRARQLGGRVAVIERGTVGGTCVNVGCVPSKTLLAAAHAVHTAAGHPFAGLTTNAGPPDLAALVGQKDGLVDQLRAAKYIEVAKEHGIELVPGEARFADPATLEVDGRALRAASYLVATGAGPAIPDLAGLADGPYLTSTTAMELTEVPRRLVTIGAGFVAMELGQLFARLGSTVTLIGRLAPRAEPELAGWLERVFLEEGLAVVAGRAVGVQRGGGELRVAVDGGTTVAGDAVLVATGRRPRTTGLGLAAAGVAVDAAGFVVVDDRMRTSNPRIFAAGDVTRGPQHVYVAAAQGSVAAENAVAGGDGTVDYRGLPSVVFTDPALASAGKTEAQAKATGHRVESRVLELDQVPRALVDHDTRGAIKLVADADSRKVLGVHAAADGAGEMLLAATYAIKFGLTVDDLASTWAPYLTMAEGLKLVAQSFRSDAKRLSCCAA